jgi:Tfp pilus assembly protein PilE
MQPTQLIAVVIALGVVLAMAVAVWRGRVRRRDRANPQARYQRDIQALKRQRRPSTGPEADDIWEAGSTHSRSKKATTWVTLGSVGCGGCAGCGGCGGCGG